MLQLIFKLMSEAFLYIFFCFMKYDKKNFNKLLTIECISLLLMAYCSYNEQDYMYIFDLVYIWEHSFCGFCINLRTFQRDTFSWAINYNKLFIIIHTSQQQNPQNWCETNNEIQCVHCMCFCIWTYFFKHPKDCNGFHDKLLNIKQV